MFYHDSPFQLRTELARPLSKRPVVRPLDPPPVSLSPRPTSLPASQRSTSNSTFDTPKMAPGGSYTQVPGSPSQLPLRHARKSSLSSRRGIPSRWRTGLICSTVALLLLGAIAHQSSSRLLGRKENELETLRGEKEGSELMGDGWRKKEDEAELVSDEAEVEAELQVEKSEQEPEWAEVGDEDVGADANQDVRPSEVEDEPVEEQGKVNDSVLDESEEVDQEIHRIEADEARLRAEAEQDGEEELCSDTVRNALSLPSFWYIRCEYTPTTSTSKTALRPSAFQQRALPLSPFPLGPPTTVSPSNASPTLSSPPASSEAFPPPNPAFLAPRRSSPSLDRCCSTTRPTTQSEFHPISSCPELRTGWT